MLSDFAKATQEQKTWTYFLQFI